VNEAESPTKDTTARIAPKTNEALMLQVFVEAGATSEWPVNFFAASVAVVGRPGAGLLGTELEQPSLGLRNPSRGYLSCCRIKKQAFEDLKTVKYAKTKDGNGDKRASCNLPRPRYVEC